MSSEILRYIESIARDKEIDRDSLISSIESSVAQAVAKKYGIDDLVMQLDRDSGEWLSNYEIDLEAEGRILAQAVKQSIIGRVREAERDVLYDEFEQRIGDIVIGSVRRIEGEAMFIDLGRNMEGILPRSERVRSENYNVGDRIRAMVFEVKKAGNRVKVILSRAHRDFVRALFELEVPEIADGIINIRRIEREPGYRTKLAVHSTDDKVDCVGACVGVRGTRIKSIIDELNGERIDIIRWFDDAEQLIVNALKPAEISHIELDASSRKALVLVDEDQLSLAIGRRGQNVRLASKLTQWDIDIMTRAELERSIAEEEGGSPETAGATAEGGSAEAAEGAEPATADAAVESAPNAAPGLDDPTASGDDSPPHPSTPSDAAAHDAAATDGTPENNLADPAAQADGETRTDPNADESAAPGGSATEDEEKSENRA